jgi:hypothetical protein
MTAALYHEAFQKAAPGELAQRAINVYNSTIVGNQAFGSPTSGGVYSGGTTNLKNTISANNFEGGNCGGTIVDNGFNLESAATCGFPAMRLTKRTSRWKSC